MARYATIAEAADYLRMSERTLRRLRAHGAIPSANPTGGHVLFDLDELDQWVNASRDLRPETHTADEFAAASKREARNRRRRTTPLRSAS